MCPKHYTLYIRYPLYKHHYMPSTATTAASNKTTEFPSILNPEFAFVEEVVAGPVELPVADPTVLLDAVVVPPRIAVPEILCGSADAVGKKPAGVMTLVYEGAKDSVKVAAEGNTENALPGEL
jgi:hypothetical protein